MIGGYIAMKGRGLVRIACVQGYGTILQCMDHPRSPWVGIPLEELRMLNTNP